VFSIASTKATDQQVATEEHGATRKEAGDEGSVPCALGGGLLDEIERDRADQNAGTEGEADSASTRRLIRKRSAIAAPMMSEEAARTPQPNEPAM
jgi:hypothetical protein